MRKLKALVPILTVATLSSAVSLVGCSYNKVTNGTVELSDAVKEKNITLQGWNIAKDTESIIVLTLPTWKEILNIEILVGISTLSTSDVTINANQITIPASKMSSANVIIKTIKLNEPTPVVTIDDISVSPKTLNKTQGTNILASDIEVTLTYSDKTTKKGTFKTDYKIFNDDGQEITTLPYSTSRVSVGTHNWKIKATEDLTKEANLTINIITGKKKVTSIEIDKSINTVNINNEIELKADVLPADAEDKTINWSCSGSSGSGTITYHDDKVWFKGLAEGDAYVIAEANDGGGASDYLRVIINKPTFKYTVTNKSSNKVIFDSFPTEVSKGEDININFTLDTTDFYRYFDDTKSDILVDGQSIMGHQGVSINCWGDQGNVVIPGSEVTGNIEIKVADILIGGEIKEDISTIVNACNTYESSSRDAAAQKSFLNTFHIINSDGSVEEQVQYFETLIGSTTNITINGQKHQVRIIDCEHDELADGSEKTAALTFELATVLSDSDGNPMTSKWDVKSNDNSDYPNSVLRKNLTGEGNATQDLWTNTALSMLPDTLINNIKSVKKQVATKTGGASEFTLATYNDKLFPLTMTEMGLIHEESSGWLEEGNAYSYWSIREYSEARRKTAAVGTDFQNYWLVSPSFAWMSVAWRVAGKDSTYPGSIDNNSDTGSKYGVSFAFCI